MVTEITPTLVSSASVMTMPTVVFIIKPSIPTLAHAPWGEGVCVLTAATIQLAASVRCVRRGFTGRLERVSRLKMCAHHVDVRDLGYSLESWIVVKVGDKFSVVLNREGDSWELEYIQCMQAKGTVGVGLHTQPRSQGLSSLPPGGGSACKGTVGVGLLGYIQCM